MLSFELDILDSKAMPSNQLQTLKGGEGPDTKEEKVYRRPTLKDKRWPYHWKYVQPSGQRQNKLEWVIVKIVKQQKKDKANDATIQNIAVFQFSSVMVP